MGIDRQDDDDTPVIATGSDTTDADEIADRWDGADARRINDHNDEAEHSDNDRVDAAHRAASGGDELDRDKYQAEYRAKVDAVYLAAARERWEATKPGLATEWLEYEQRNPAPPDAAPDLDTETCTEVERGCKGIRETEENIVTPAMVRIEAQDPERQLIGLEFRCKGQDRIMEKVARQTESQPTLTPGEALASVKDAIRYTFQYGEDHYAEGVYADVDRLKAEGFELVELRNSWGREEYKGINSRWRAPEIGQLFEVQFHTEISFEAKQLTHPAYERLRIQSTSKAERDELENFQRGVNLYVPVPQGAPSYPDYP